MHRIMPKCKGKTKGSNFQSRCKRNVREGDEYCSLHLDFVTYEELENPSICHRNKCTSCETIKLIRNQDKVEFDCNPMKKLFDSSDKDQKLKNDIKNTCDLKLKCIQKNLHELIQSLDMEQFDANVKKIQQKIINNKNAIHILNTYNEIVKLTPKWKRRANEGQTTQESLIRSMKKDILDITTGANFKCGVTHHPTEVPAALFEYIAQLTSLSRARIKKSLGEMTKGTQACFEGKLGLIVDNVYHLK